MNNSRCCCGRSSEGHAVSLLRAQRPDHQKRELHGSHAKKRQRTGKIGPGPAIEEQTDDIQKLQNRNNAQCNDEDRRPPVGIRPGRSRRRRWLRVLGVQEIDDAPQAQMLPTPSTSLKSAHVRATEKFQVMRTRGAKARRQTLNEMNIMFRKRNRALWKPFAVRPPPKHSHYPAETRKGGADAGEAEEDVQDMLVHASDSERFLRGLRARFRRSLVFDSARSLGRSRGHSPLSLRTADTSRFDPAQEANHASVFYRTVALTRPLCRRARV